MTLVHSALAGGEWIDDADGCVPAPPGRCSATGLPRPPRWARSCARSPGARPASSTRSPAKRSARAWAAGAGPGTLAADHRHRLHPLPDLRARQARRGGDRPGRHARLPPACGQRGRHRDVLHSRLREGVAHSGRGAASFLAETFNRARRAGATGPITMRADSGFYNHKVVAACRSRACAARSPSSSPRLVRDAIAHIPDRRLDSDPVLAGRRRRRGRDQLPALRPQGPHRCA